jgi:arylsulfatase A-like enzyme
MRKARAVTDIALNWLAHHGDRPFFLYLHYMDPHANYQPQQPFHPGPPDSGAAIRPFVEQGQAGGVANRMQSSRRFRLSPAEDRRLLDLYEGEIWATDYQLGRLLAHLQQSGLAGNTVVVFVADHGEEFADHGKYAHATSLFDELVRVPLLIRLPLRERTRRRVEAVVCSADLGPTLLDLAGVPHFPGGVDARAFTVLLDGDRTAADPREAYFELNPYSRDPLAPGTIEATRGVRYGGLKLLYQVRTGRYQLYDLASDPGERRSLYDESDPRSAGMAARLSRYLVEADEASTVGGGLLDDRQLRQLDALGYLDREQNRRGR